MLASPAASRSDVWCNSPRLLVPGDVWHDAAQPHGLVGPALDRDDVMRVITPELRFAESLLDRVAEAIFGLWTNERELKSFAVRLPHYAAERIHRRRI